jgi:peroxiredoxin
MACRNRSMKFRGGLLALALLGLAASAAAGSDGTAATAAPAETPPEVGLAVGQQAPDFALQDQFGHTVTLDALRRTGPVAVVFFRSGDWCAYCKMQLIQLQKNLPEIQAAGGQLVGISYDTAEILQGFTRRSQIIFPLLSDPDSRTITAYDIVTRNAPDGFKGVSRHGTFVVDRKGVIRSKLFQVSYAERPALDNLLAALKAAR